ncbi:O-methylsterigmatocystin oxidoreductase [Mycena venus]|uniref:O-methylsterigmatocystin oxidoreductase n=1 Tax=Mycena venus TaxID=2733690 RepID=A0A8H6WZ05_9AGAR|nr:O-methylsterigmatocystin oxidoreductase [Mycena venus]
MKGHLAVSLQAAMDPTLACLSATLVCAAGYLLLRSRKEHPPFAPGPPANPIVGNILQLPTSAAWFKCMEWKAKYGDLVYLHGIGKSVLIVNNLSCVTDLLERRWSIYSHRPTFTAVGELMGVDQSLALMSYGEEWREHRKIVHGSLNPTAVKKWHAVQQEMAALLNKDLLNDPREFQHHIRLTASRIVLYVGYGLFAPDMEDPYIQDNEKTMDIIGHGMSPGAFLCDLFPILKYSPSWVPFQRRIAESKKVIERTGMAPPSLAKDLIMSGNDESYFQNRATWAVSSMYGAGTETTSATVQTFVLAMALYPNVQKRAQDEIDTVVGLDRMPVIADMPQLPFIQALIKETLRWHPPVPLSIPHRTTQDDIYEGFFIPKDTIVFPNIWAITRDTSNPEEFNPDRFLLESDKPVDPFGYVFGTGRRICTGMHLAENSVFAMVSGILFAFNIASPTGAKLVPRFNSKHISSPENFECTITPRSEAKAELVRQIAADVTIGV